MESRYHSDSLVIFRRSSNQYHEEDIIYFFLKIMLTWENMHKGNLLQRTDMQHEASGLAIFFLATSCRPFTV